MLKISEPLNDFDNALSDCFTSESVQPSNHKGKIVIISFININSTIGWTWLQQFVFARMKKTDIFNYHFIAVIYTGESDPAFDASKVRNKINVEIAGDPEYYGELPWSTSGKGFNIVADEEATPGGGIYNKYASFYLSYIKQDTDNGFCDTKTPPSKTWTYIALKNVIVDKWHEDCDVTPADPLSFHQMSAGSVAFNPTDYSNAKEYVDQRLENLISRKIDIKDPKEGSVFKTVPGPVKIVFSRPALQVFSELGPASNPDNYELSEIGATGLSVSIPSYTPVNFVENFVTLNLSLSTPPLADGDFKIKLKSAITDTIPKNPAVTPITYTSFSESSISADYTISYKIDTISPVVNSVSISGGIIQISTPASVTINAVDSGSGVDGWIITNIKTQPLLTAAWNSTNIISVPLTHGGTNTFYAWAKDKAGNISALNDNSYFDVIYKQIPWEDVLLRKFVGDSGFVPETTGGICASPDVICSGTSSVNPSPDYNSGHFHPVVVNQKNYFFVRVKNLGGAIPENGAECYLHYTPSSLFMHPEDWITRPMKCNPGTGLQNNNPFPALANNAVAYAKYPFEWTPTSAQSAVHHCVICVCKTPEYPWDGVNLPHIKTESDYYFWIRNNPNVCFHNVSFETASPAPGGKQEIHRKDQYNNKFKKELVALIEIQTAGVHNDTDVIVQIKDTATGRVVVTDSHKVRGRAKDLKSGITDLYVSQPAVLEGMTSYEVSTRVISPEGQPFIEGTQIDVRSYIATQSREIQRLKCGTDMRRVREIDNIYEAIWLRKTLGGPNLPRMLKKVNFIQVGGCTSIICDPESKRQPAVRIERVLPEIRWCKRIESFRIVSWFVLLTAIIRKRPVVVIEKPAAKVKKTGARPSTKLKPKPAAKKAASNTTAAKPKEKAKPAAQKSANPKSSSAKKAVTKTSTKKSKIKK